jgi:hypothetical protein
MPLGAFEQEVLRLLAVNRNPDSYVAGATVLNQNPASPRTSKDVDLPFRSRSLCRNLRNDGWKPPPQLSN